VDRKGGETHTGDALEHSSLHHDGPIVFDSWDVYVLGHGDGYIGAHVCFGAGGLRDRFGARMEHFLVSTICFVSFVADISDQVCPRDAICASH
jgi:hypothetical protein